MSVMRKLAREVARNLSYRRTRTTDEFKPFFEELWKERLRKSRKMRRKPVKGR